MGGSWNSEIYHYQVWVKGWPRMSIYQSRGYKKHFWHAPIHFVERWTLYSECKVLLIFLNAKLLFFSCKQERWKWAASARSCVWSWEARSHQQITQVGSIFRGNTEYSLPPNMVHYTVKLLGLKISRTLKPIITRKSRYINYSIIWRSFFFNHLQTPIPIYTVKERLPVWHSHAVFPVLGSTGSLSAKARRGFPEWKLPTEWGGQEMASDVPYKLVKWHDTGKYKIRWSVTLFFSKKVTNWVILLHTFCNIHLLSILVKIAQHGSLSRVVCCVFHRSFLIWYSFNHCESGFSTDKDCWLKEH